MFLRFPKGLSLLAGALSAIGFAPLGIWPATLICLALLYYLINAAPTKKQAFTRGWLFGVGHFAIGLNWIATAFTFQAAMPAWLGWVAVLALSLYLAIYPGLAALSAYYLGRNRPIALVFGFAAIWIITEWLRSWVMSGFAWNPLAVIAVDAGWSARFIGTYGLSALVALAAGVLYFAAINRRKAALYLGIPILSLGLVSAAMLRSAPLTLAQTNTATPVTVVQPNISQADKWQPDFADRNFALLADQTVSKQPPTDIPARPRLVFWPEAAIPDYIEDGYPERLYYPFTARTNRSRIVSLIGPQDVLVTGALKLDFNDQGRTVAAANSVFALNAGGDILGSYDKSHLVPFGEYLPLEGLLSAIGLSRVVPGAIPFTPGPGPRNIDLGDFGVAGLQLCYEIIFSGQVVDPDNRPDFLFNPSNDAWFGKWGPPQHLAQARLRAVEENLPIIRSTPTGISAVIDRNGTVLGQVEAGISGHVDSILPPSGAPTLFGLWGNIASLMLAFLLLLMAVAFRRRGH